MYRHIRALAFVVALCASAGITSTASAAVKAGEIVNSNSEALVKSNFKGTGGEQVLETVAGVKVTCKKGFAVGTVLSTTEATQTLTFKECKNSLAQKCQGGNAGTAGTEEIKIGGTKVTIGFVKGSSKEKLALIAAINGTFAFKCSTVNQEAKGAFITPVGENQEEKLKSLFSFTATGTAGVQSLTEYENTKSEIIKATPESNLAGEGFKQSDQVGTEDVTFEEEAKFGSKGFIETPNVQASPTAGGAEVSFVGKAAGEKEEITVENLGFGGKGLVAYLKEEWVEEGGGKPEEMQFKIIPAAVKPCNMPTVNPFEKLPRLAQCHVGIEFVTGKAGEKATYLLRYNCWAGFLLCGAEKTVKIKS